MAQNKSMMAQKKSTGGLPSNITKAQFEKKVFELIENKLGGRRSKANSKKFRMGSGAEALAPFKGVSQLDVAPVSIGNTIRSVKQQVIPLTNGVRVIGRDFVQTIGGQTTTFTGWCFQGGMGLSPIALNASGLRGFFQTFERYKWNNCLAHYITSSPTSLSGDVLFFYHSNHAGPKVDHTSTNFLSYALSTDAALIGPQWTNHSVGLIHGTRDWLNTDVLNAEDVQHQADGELLVYCKNTTNGSQADPPGYLLIDYDITFERRMLNPRVNVLPSSLFKWFPTGLLISGVFSQYDVVASSFNTTNSYTGTTVGQPVGAAIGNIYQVVLDLQQVAITGASVATVFSANIAFTNTGATNPIAYPLTTGTTLFLCAASVSGNGSYAWYPNYDAVFAGNCLKFTAGVTISFSCAAVMCCVGSVGTAFLQANIG